MQKIFFVLFAFMLAIVVLMPLFAAIESGIKSNSEFYGNVY